MKYERFAFMFNKNYLKRIIMIIAAAAVLTSCSFEPYEEIVEYVSIGTTTANIEKTTKKTPSATESTDKAESVKSTETTAEQTTTAQPVTTVKTSTTAQTTTVTTTAPKDTNAEYIQSLFDDKKSDVWVTGSGKVTRVLADDTKGDKHQRFILEISTGLTLLVAHNIDIAPRIDDIKKGDVISFYGEYIYSDEGGTLHWTHHDPDGSSDGGWLKKDGAEYK
ncbi:MAG: DUF3465 domain-containing protein [Ruminococcus sp.]|jgi:hypothetical protein|nr:DUF3465 domain-containing protein [Ruminococcus sp.]